MRQFFESLILFQVVTSRYFPLNRYLPLPVMSAKPKRYKKWAIMSAIMLVAFIVQLKTFTSCKFPFNQLRLD